LKWLLSLPFVYIHIHHMSIWLTFI
jgi:hypothetical protein